MGGFEAALPFGLRRPLGALRPLDALVLGYLAAAVVPLSVGTARGLSGCEQELLLDLSVLAGLGLLIAVSRTLGNALLVLLRLAYVPLLFAPLYRQTATIWPVLHALSFDGAITHAEQVLLGMQPSATFAQHAPWPWLSELFCLAYFVYYLFLPAMLLVPLLTRGYAAAEEALFAATLCFCACLVVFWLFPTVGPLYWFAPHAGPELFPGYVFNHAVYAVTARAEVPTGAFPSSHVAVAVLLTMRARRIAPRLFPFMLAVTALMCFAVVYLKEHYALDVPAGILVALLADRIASGIGLAKQRPRRFMNAGPLDEPQTQRRFVSNRDESCRPP